MTETFKIEFNKIYGKPATSVYYCPGRVNLIGEHIDYNGGLVMPCAISLGSWLLVAKNEDNKLRFRSKNFEEIYETGITGTFLKQDESWYNYPLGIVHFISQYIEINCGLDLYFAGNLPVGAGLSSSASIEVCTAFALNHLFQGNITPKEMVLLAQKAENEFIGVPCGIMDQYAVCFGKKDEAMLLNCARIEHEYIPFDTRNYCLLVMNTNKPRSLVHSKYNERYAACQYALKLLQEALLVNHLCEINFHQFEQHRHLLKDTTLERRVIHVISEQFRVGEARDALRFGQLETFGKLLFASHRSLKDFYEVTGTELDTIIDFCKTFNGCIGARMTGAGFGGCAIALVEKELVNEFGEKLQTHYSANLGYSCTINTVEVSNGVHYIN
jgi:galactokinase